MSDQFTNNLITPDQQAALREPFPPSAIGKLPRGNIMLDYVGHAATTDRLLSVDPTWVWEPVAFDEDGLPAFDGNGGLWIKLTVCGVTRYGYGDAGGKKGPLAVKEAIGDAIRNAAMRFGVALDLWAKEDISDTSAPSQGIRVTSAKNLEAQEKLSEFLADTPTVELGPLGVTQKLSELERLMVAGGFWSPGTMKASLEKRGTTLDELSDSITDITEFAVSAYEAARKKVGV